jgi:cytochrome c biogenesis protein
MAHRVSSTTRQPASIPARGVAKPKELAEARKRPQRDRVEVIWNLFCSIRFAVVLNVALALAAMLGTIIPQMQPGIQNFEQELDAFLTGATGRYGDFSNFLYWAGFYDLYNSLWFRMLVALTVFSIVICTLNRWQPIMRLINHPQVRVSESFMAGMTEKAQFRAVPLPVDEATTLVTTALRKSRYRVLSAPSTDGSGLHLYADRDRWSKLVTFVSHAGLVMLILTAAGVANMGWREQSVYFYPGQPVSVGHDTDFSVRNDGFSIEYYDDQKSIKEYRHTLAVIENDQVVLTKTIIVNDPLTYKGINFFLVSYQPVVYAQAKGPSGQNVLFKEMGASGPTAATTTKGATLVKFNQPPEDTDPLDYLQFSVPDHIITLKIKYNQETTRTEAENPPLYIQAFVDKNFDTPIYDNFLPRTGPLKLPGYEQYSIGFKKDTATVLEIAKDPGLGLLAFFFMVMAGGFTVSLYTTFTRCWVRISANGENNNSVNILVSGLAEKNKVTFERDFERMAGRMRDNLAGATRTKLEA